MIAIRLADLVSPAGPAAQAGRTALVVAGTPGIRAGEQLVFVKVVAAAPAVVRRDGRVQASGHPADHARLGALEQQLDELAGPGVIDEIAARATLGGKVKGKARRSMTAAAAIRATILMALMPDADYAGVLTAVFGDLALVPWQRPFQVPTPKMLGTWRAALGPAPLAALQGRLLTAVGGEHRDHDYRAVHIGELRLGSIDGSVTRVPDTPACRRAFGSAGTADDSGPCARGPGQPWPCLRPSCAALTMAALPAAVLASWRRRRVRRREMPGGSWSCGRGACSGRARRERLPRDHGHLAMMDASMAYLRQFVPDVLAAVRFAGGPGMDDLLQAVTILAGLYATRARKVPDGAPGGFVPARWAGYLEKAAKDGDVTATGTTGSCAC